MGGWDKDRAPGMSSLANEEPLVVMKASIDIVREVVGKDCGDSRYSVVGKGKTPLCRSGCGSLCKGTSGAEDRDESRGRSIGGHRGSEVVAAWRGDEDIVGVNGNMFVKRGEEEGVEDFLCDLGRSGRHCR